MNMDIEKILGNPLKVYSKEPKKTQDKMIIRIKKQEPEIDIMSTNDTSDQEEIVSYTCEFVQKVDETESEVIELSDDDDDDGNVNVDDDDDDDVVNVDDDDDDIIVDDDDDDNDEDEDEDMESIRQDDDFIYPKIIHSDEEDRNDATWLPPTLTSEERKKLKCVYPKNEKPASKKNKGKNNNTNKEPKLKKDCLPQSKKVLECINVKAVNGTITKKDCDSIAVKIGKPRKGMSTAKQRLGRIIKIHKMMK